MNIAVETHAADVQLVPLETDYSVYRRRVIFDCYKWDPQVDDANTIADHACVLSAATAAFLSRSAEALSAETLALETALAQRPDLFADLGLSRQLGKLCAEPLARQHPRVMRFDFHPTTDGWAISEVNCDVPGGFAEAGALPALASALVPGTEPGPDPGLAIVDTLRTHIEPGTRIAFVHATAFSDDRQVMQFLAARAELAGFACVLVAPDHLRWSDGHVRSIAERQSGPVDAIVRFFPAEWLPALPRRAQWQNYFRSRFLSLNPPQALLTQSKRLPLVWDELGVPAPTWRALLPETRSPRRAPWRTDDSWLIKPAFGRVGEGVVSCSNRTAKEWRQAARGAFLFPRSWIAQRRFESRQLASAHGPRHLCVGVFTVGGKAAGFYGRLSARTTIERHAQDVPVLVLKESKC
jgi:glutathionylspermidine synthase